MRGYQANNNLVDVWTSIKGTEQRASDSHTWGNTQRNPSYPMSMRIDLIMITAQSAHKITRCERMPTRMGSDHYGVMMRVDTHKPDLCLEEAMHAGVADIEKRAVTDGIMDDIRRADTAASVRGGGDEQPRIERKPCVVITTETGEIEALIDTGAGPTLVTEQTLGRHWPEAGQTRTPDPDGFLRFANNKIEGPMDRVTLRIDISGISRVVRAYVVPECPYDMLIGWDEMVAMGLNLAITDGKIVIDSPDGESRSVDFLPKEGPRVLKPITMIAKRDLTLRAYETLAIEACFESRSGAGPHTLNCEGMIFANVDDPMIAPDSRQHVSVRQGTTKIRIRNMAGSERRIKRNTPWHTPARDHTDHPNKPGLDRGDHQGSHHRDC